MLCSASAITSRNVRQELQLAWDSDRPILPVILEQVEFPDAISYFLQGRQWIDATDRPQQEWLEELKSALERLGMRAVPAVAPANECATNGFPAPLGPLIGRDQQVEDIVQQLLGGSRLVTLTGPGGVGKTRIALAASGRAGSSFQGGAEFIDLSPISNAELVPSAIAHGLGIHESGDRSVRETLLMALRNRQLLLLLDNFEQVIDAAPLTGELLMSAPQLHMLVTSREALRVRGEEEVVIQPLEVPAEKEVIDLERLMTTPAVALFVETARFAKPGFALEMGNATPVAELSRRLDGLPLATELAATRVKHFPPVTLLDHLDQRLPILTGGRRDLPARHQTLEATIAWSYELLLPGEQALFRRLAVFAGGGSLEAIQVVIPAAGPLELDLLTGLASLVDKSLVRERLDFEGMPRFSMLETIREFALNELDRAGETETALTALAAWVLQFFESGIGGDNVFVSGIHGLRHFDEELDNIRLGIGLAHNRGEADFSTRLFVAIYGYLYIRGLFREAASIGEKCLELSKVDAIADSLQGEAQCCLAVLVTILDSASAAELLAREGLGLLQRSRARDEKIGRAFVSLAIVLREQGRLDEAIVCAEQALALFDPTREQGFRSFALYHVGKLAFLQNDLDRAVACLTDALNQSLELDPNETGVYSAGYLTAAHGRRGELTHAAATLRTAERLWRAAGSGIAGLFLHVAGALAAASSHPQIAVTLFAADSAQAASFGINPGNGHGSTT